MDKNIKKKFSFLIFLMLGFTTTQLYQNCAPLPLEGFSVASSQLPGHEDGMGSHPSTEVTKPLPTQKRLVAPKSYVAALFREIFTSTKYPVTNLEGLIDAWVFFKGAQYGGSCNLYSSYSNRDCSGSLANTNLSPYTDSNTVRESFRIQMCDNALGLDNGVHAALEKVSLKTTSPINFSNVSLAYGLFYRNGPPETIVIDSLLDLNKSLTQANESVINRWRAILSQICDSPTWQLL